MQAARGNRQPLCRSDTDSTRSVGVGDSSCELTAGQFCFELIGDLEQLLDELTQFAVVHRLALDGCLKINAAIGTTRLNATL